MLELWPLFLVLLAVYFVFRQSSDSNEHSKEERDDDEPIRIARKANESREKDRASSGILKNQDYAKLNKPRETSVARREPISPSTQKSGTPNWDINELIRKRREEALFDSGFKYQKPSRPRSQIQKYLEENDIQVLYHFTNVDNLASIKRSNGLLSWKRCMDQRIQYRGGGNELSRQLDRRSGFEDYVRLSFCSDHPMKWRLENSGQRLFLFEIDPAVLDEPGVLFSNMNANHNCALVREGIEGLRLVDLNATQRHYVSRSDPDFKTHQAEVLVPGFVALKYIKNFPTWLN